MNVGSNPTLRDVAEAAHTETKTRADAVNAVLGWIRRNPERYEELAEDRDILVAESLVDKVRHSWSNGVSPNRKGVETENRVDAETQRAVTRKLADRQLDYFRERFPFAGGLLGDCTRCDILKHCGDEESKARGHMLRARFGRLVAQKLKDDDTPVRKALKESVLAALYQQAKQETEPALALAGN